MHYFNQAIFRWGHCVTELNTVFRPCSAHSWSLLAEFSSCDSVCLTPLLHQFSVFRQVSYFSLCLCSYLYPPLFTRLFIPTLIHKNMHSRCSSAAEEMPPPLTLSVSCREWSAVSLDVFNRLFCFGLLASWGQANLCCSFVCFLFVVVPPVFS